MTYIPKRYLHHTDDDLLLDMLSHVRETWGGIMEGKEVCTCGRVHEVYAPLSRIVKSCDRCGLLLDMILGKPE
jgi:hypothetical protein